MSNKVKLALALFAGLVVWQLLLPLGGCDDFEPSRCYGLFRWYTVPDQWVAWVAGAATAGVLFLVLGLKDRRT